VIAKGHEPRPWFEVQASAETLGKTNRSGWCCQAATSTSNAHSRWGDELGGHIDLGHVDGMATVVALRPRGGHSLAPPSVLPRKLARLFIAPKGSVALVGSLAHRDEVEGAESRHKPHSRTRSR
jgi:riboflavin synthase